LKRAGKNGFIVYIGAGDPNFAATRELAWRLIKPAGHWNEFQVSTTMFQVISINKRKQS